MEDLLREKLENGGIDVNDAMGRFMNSDAMFIKFLKKFPLNTDPEELKKAIEAGDHEAALAHSHSLKGVCGNLSMKELFDLFNEQVSLYRAGKPEEADAMMPEIEAKVAAMNELIASLG